MKSNKRTRRILMSVNYNESDSEGSSTGKGNNEKDPFKDTDDIDADLTYVLDENNPPAAISRESSGSQPTCDYVSCTSEVFAACSKCSSFLCWDHFDDYESFNNCANHSNIVEKPFDSTLTDLHDDSMFSDKTLTDQHNVMSPHNTLSEHKNIIFIDKKLTGQHNLMSRNKTLTDCCNVASSNVILNDISSSKYQHCEYEKCIEEVFSTCTQCKGFLCILHFDKFIADQNCSMHQSFSTEISNEPNTDSIALQKRKESMKKMAKKNRNLGFEYISSKKKRVEARSLKQPCSEKTCRLQCTNKINTEARKVIFDRYWNLGDINRQRDFIKNHTEEVKPKYRYPCDNCNTVKKMRAYNYAFNFELESNRIRVCKQFFKATLDINDKVIKTVREKTNTEGFVAVDMRGKHTNRFQLVEETNNVHKFINMIPRVESHYLRAQTTRNFIEGGRSLSQLYEDYKKSSIELSKKIVSKSTFSNIFHRDFNLSFFTPKKDRCEICVSYENSSQEEKAIIQKSFDVHQREKQLSRDEKKRDKEKVNPLYVVACYDLQAVLPAPRGEVSVFYYISKLATYNLTIAELLTGSTTCFVWHEGQGHRGVTEIGSCVLKYLEKKSQEVDCDDLEVVFYSDNCCGQQKNRMMIALYVYAINTFKIKSITHKFLIKGHTQNEGDAVHSTIEKEIKRALKSGPIYSPQEYVTLIKTAKKKPPYFKVEELSFADFYDVKGLCELLGNNYTKSTENETIKIAEMKIMQFRKDDPFAFYVKTSYECTGHSTFKRIEIKKNATRNKTFSLPENLNKAYTQKIMVNDKKKKEIMKLIENRHVPKTYFDFYNAL